MNECSIAKYRPEHKRPIAELQKGLWSSDSALNTRYLEWKYERNPYVQDILIYVALDGAEIVGMRGFHGARLEAGSSSQTFPAVFADDALVSSRYRNRGLATRMLKFAHADLGERGHRYAFSPGNANRMNGLGLMKLGWKSAGGLRPMGRISEKARRRARLRRIVARQPLIWRFSDARFLAYADQRQPFRHLDASIGGHSRSSALPITVERMPRLDAMAELVERLGHDGRIRQVRDRAYLAWRFDDPLSEFRFVYCGKGRLDGYLVLGRRASDLGAFDRVYVADLEAIDDAVREGLVCAAIDCGRFPEFVTWSAILSDEELRAFTGQGFVPVDTEEAARGFPCVLVQRLPDGFSDDDWTLAGRPLLDLANWDVRVLYSMRV